MFTELNGLDAISLAELVRSKQISAVELLESTIAKAEALNPELNFLAQRHYDYGRAAIEEGVGDGAFAGVPLLLKDLNIYVEGLITENGSRSRRGAVATYTMELVHRMERAGFVIFGKTTSPEFGLSSTTEGSLHGATRNPWNVNHTPGGSSGGAAVAVSAGVVPMAHATDGGGSIRIPASCCGLFGLKPSRGRNPMGPKYTERWGGMPAHHVVSWTVRDSAAMLDATHGREPGSRYDAPQPEGTFLSHVTKDPGALRIAVMCTSFSGAKADPEVAEAVGDAGRLLESLGHHVEEAAPSVDGNALRAAASVLIGASVAADVDDWAKLTGIKPGPEVLEIGTLATVGRGRTYAATDWARANDTLMAAAITIGQFMQEFDVILSPTLALPPVPIGTFDLADPGERSEWATRVNNFSPFAQVANATGQPAMSLPLGMSTSGLPIGVMATGRYGEEALLFSLAGQIERAAPWIGRKPPTRSA